jgi:hypothetical protein
MPRFREEAATVLSPPVPHEATIALKSAAARGQTSELAPDFKLSMAFSESRFVVPWVSTIAKRPRRHSSKSPLTQEGVLHEEGEVSTLRHLKVTFLYSGSDILQVKWDGEYKTDGEASKDRGWGLSFGGKTDEHRKGNSTHDARRHEHDHDVIVK